MLNTPNLTFLKQPEKPAPIFIIYGEAGPKVILNRDGSMEFKDGVLDISECAKTFWQAVHSQVPPQFLILSDLQFCKTVLESKGILWRDAKDQAEMKMWLDQIAQKWGLT